ncbi:MAG TPA: hypothetical protein VL588_08385 [Bdellovibrionota bacterium]|jgi:hypothetical protein|nr:hypothetical protein [Bdellovibrionota bacterium]
MVCGGLASILALVLASSVRADEGIGAVLNLNDSLPQAVCDQAAVSRAPTLESTRLGRAARGSTLIPLQDYSVKLEVGESQVIRFVMEDPGILLAQPRLLDLWEAARGRGDEGLESLKRKISLEVCTAQVTPGKIQSLLDHKPDLFLPLQVGATAPKAEESAARFVLRDVEERYGVVRGKWWVAGWVEPFEVREVRVGRRSYRRLAQPITNQLRLIQVQDGEGLPLGFLYLSPEGAAPAAWPALLAQADSPANRRKRIEAYLLQVEEAAYEALARSPAKTEGIRDLQEFYKSLLNAYQIYPDDPRFAGYSDRPTGAKKAGPRESPDAEAKRLLGADFFEALSRAQARGSHVAFSYFRPDRRLHAIFTEYLKRLATTAQ